MSDVSFPGGSLSAQAIKDEIAKAKAKPAETENTDEGKFKVKKFFQGSIQTDPNDTSTIKKLMEHEFNANTLSFSKAVSRNDVISQIDKSTLSPEQKEIAKKLFENVSDQQIDLFVKMLKNGTLTKKDSEGVTVLERLNKILTTERNPNLEKNGITAKHLLNQAIRTLADPTSINQGVNKGTCGAATMEYILAKNDPAEMLRIIEGLTSKSGSVTLRDGKKLTLPENSIPGDKSGRKDIDRMVQSAIMDKANLMGADYDNPSDDGGFIAVVGGNSAIPIGKFKDLYQSVTGRPMDDPSSYLWGEEDVAARIQSAVAKGEDVPVMMSFGGAFAYHWLTVQEVKYDASGKPESVVLRNPWGSNEDGKGDPPRKNLGGGLIEMKWSDFVKNLDGAVIAQDLGNKPIASDKMPVNARVDAIKTLMDGYTNGKEEGSIKEILTSSSPEDLSAILDKINLKDLVGELDDKDVAAVMKKLALSSTTGNNGKHLLALMKNGDDDVAMEFLKGMSDDQLKNLAKNPEGREALQQARKNLDKGWTNDSEYSQINRIDKLLSSTMGSDEKVSKIKSLMSGYTNGTDEKAIKQILLDSSPEELSGILDKINLKDLVSELDDGDMADVMKKLALNPTVGNNAKHLNSIMKHGDDDLAMDFLKKMSDDQLKTLAKTPEGKAALQQAWKNLDSGWTTGSEEDQMNRIKRITG